jgi:uncharacterized lipoprotein YajG
VTRARGACRRGLGVLAVLLIAGGCASSSGLDIGYPAASANRAMLGSVAPLRIGISPVVDRRLDAVRIGSASKGGQDLVTSRPVPEIVHDALVTEIGKNGHAVVTADTDAILTAEVDEFWLDIVPGYPETHYVGKVAIALAIVNARTGERMIARRYIGIRRQQANPDSPEARRDVMDTALARTMRDLATDRELVAALSRLRRSAPTT